MAEWAIPLPLAASGGKAVPGLAWVLIPEGRPDFSLESVGSPPKSTFISQALDGTDRYISQN